MGMKRETLRTLAYNAMTLMAGTDGYTMYCYDSEDEYIENEAEELDITVEEARIIYDNAEFPEDWSDDRARKVTFALISELEENWVSHHSLRGELGISPSGWKEYQQAVA